MKQQSTGSVHRAFVVRFDSDIEIGSDRMVGRIEHISTGQTAMFHSLPELLAFVGKLLDSSITQETVRDPTDT